MSFQLSSIITDLQTESLSIAHSGRANARRVARAVHQRFGALRAPDVYNLQLSLIEIVEEGKAELLELDANHVYGVVGSRLQTRARDQAFAETFGVLAGIRSAVEGIYGETARIEMFGDVSALPGNPLELHRLGVRIYDQLTGDELLLPPVRLPGFAPLDREQLAAGLKRPLNRLGDAVDTLGLERKDTDVTLRDKTAGIEGYRRTLRFAAGCLASLYGLAGFDDLAAKIRPKRRAPRRPSEPEDPGGEAVSPEAPEEAASAAGDGAAEPASPADAADVSAANDPVEPTGPIGIVR